MAKGRPPKRRVRIGLALAAVVVALVFLQVRPLDGWRWHTVLRWQVVPSSTSETWQRSPGTFTLPRSSVARLTYAVDGSLPQDLEVIVGDLDNAERYHNGNSTAEDVRPVRGPDFLTLWLGDRAYPSRQILRKGSSAGRRYIEAPAHQSRLRGANLAWPVRYVVSVNPFAAKYPSVRFEVSMPYGYWYVPIEDYLVALALIWLVFGRFVKRGYREGRPISP